ncbi:glycosyltransferase family 9 protein [Amnibacterium kyonggiense]|uniref:ADP-heptose:LPS heptosyltransferase n=1 Tax=Amnibacterium kyonggiense TaxID=595671 RepID=A0A4R7FPI4_9MICO|nr:glycosyltransferase family 9 protein [Amnibacterium kyonggiense]TDS79667.1 ADP-heptose:LPS heptosyltransferase [Amnibacterium kyonggiense]
MRIVLVDTMGGLGDLVLALPLVEALQRSHPGAELAVVTTAPWHVLLARDPGIAEVVPVPGRDAETISATVESALRRIRPDLAVTTNRQHGLPELLERWSARAITNLWRSPPANEPVDLRMLRLLAEDGAIDAALARVPPRIVLDDDERAAGRELLRALAPVRPLLLLPDSGMPVKRWPLDSWSGVVRAAAADGAQPVVVSEVVEQREALHAAGAAVAPALGLRELAGLFAAAGEVGGRATGGDTGPVRVAAAAGLPVVGLFGPTVATRYGYRGPGAVNLQGYPECPVRTPTAITEQACWWTARCPLTPTGRPRCTEDIRVRDVLAALAA